MTLDAYIYDGIRSPFGRHSGALATVRPDDLMADVLRALMARTDLPWDSVEDVILGNVCQSGEDSRNMARFAGLMAGLPEVELGLLPGAGGTQRLTRLTGIASVLDIICTGRDVSGSDALSPGILGHLSEGTARDIGRHTARDVLAGKLNATPTDSLTVQPDEEAVEKARQKFAGKHPAPLKAIESIEAATRPIDEGLGHERKLFMELMDSDERAGLVHAFFAERATAKIPVRAELCDGFIGNRILTRYRRLCEYLVLDGAVGDLAGLDIAKATRDRKAATRPENERYSNVADLICDKGRFGHETGQGYYLYEDGKKIGPNPGAVDIIASERARLGIAAQEFTDQDIVDSILTAMIQEAAVILQEGIALRPVDTDAVQLFDYGFSRHRGGPMHLADQIGLPGIIARIDSYATEDSYFWQVPELLRDMSAPNQTFADLNEVTS